MRQVHTFRCPVCGDRDAIDITALVDVRITDTGTDADLAADGTHFWEGHSPARCGACDHTGEAYEFRSLDQDAWIVADEAAVEGGAS